MENYMETWVTAVTGVGTYTSYKLTTSKLQHVYFILFGLIPFCFKMSWLTCKSYVCRGYLRQVLCDKTNLPDDASFSDQLDIAMTEAKLEKSLTSIKDTVIKEVAKLKAKTP